MNFDFGQSMQEASDAELLKIITIARDDYQEAAVIAAEQEVARRNLTVEQIEELKISNLKEKNMEDWRAKQPLDLALKIATCMFPMFFTFILSGYYKANGFDKKANDLAKWTMLGFLFYIALIITLVLIF